MDWLRMGLPVLMASVASMASAQVTVDLAQTVYRADPLFFGINTLFWLDDDACRRDGSYARSVAELGVRLMRFPGGTVADNFHWRENRLHNIERFPYSDGPEKLGFDEFMEVCRTVKAEPIVVANVHSWWREGDVAGGAAEAAAWGRYCREKGYRVKYWEIGNEIYHGILLGARDYAAVVKVYAHAMKAVDPEIQIGAVGHWDTQDVGARDRVDPAHYDELVKAEAEHAGAEGVKAYKDLAHLHIKKDRRDGSPQWWPTLMELAAPEIDFAVIHWYFGANGVGQLDTAIRALKAMLDEKAGRPIPLALTEWNIGSQMQKSLTRYEHDLAIAEAALRFMDAGVTMANYWPARINGGNYTLMAMSDNALTDSGKVFRLLSGALLERRVETRSDAPGVYAFATADAAGGRVNLLLVNRGQADHPELTVSLAGGAVRALQAQALTEANPAEPKPVSVTARGEGVYALSLPARSLCLLSGE